MKSRLRSTLVASLLFLFVATVAGTPSYSVAAGTDGSECCDCTEEIYTTFQTKEDGSLDVREDGAPIVVEAAAPPAEPGVLARRAADEVCLQAECTTQSQNGTTRRACDSSTRTHRLPAGYWFNEAKTRVSWQHRRGSENDAHVSFSHYIEVLPGFYAPTVMSFYVHARSDGIGTRGKSKATVCCPYHRVP